jgi:thiol:disulfide interchange protein DsbD
MSMLLAFVAIISSHQAAAPIPTTELVASVRAAAPGKPFTVGLHMKLPEGWHNYYANPGESGVPTTIEWTLPAGFKAGPIQWPLPKRMDIDKVSMYGYDGDLWLTSTITPSATVKPGPILLKAKASWLLCSIECVPQSANLSLSMTVAKKSVSNVNQGLNQALKLLPSRTLPWSVSAVATQGAVQLGVQYPVKSGSGVMFFPSDPESFTADTPKFTAVHNGFQLSVPLSRYATKPPKRMTGILVIPTVRTVYWVDIPVAS